MKKQTFGAFVFTLAGIGFLSGCAFGNTLDSISVKSGDKKEVTLTTVEPGVLTPTKIVNNSLVKTNNLTMIRYTGKNGLVSFEYPEATYMPGESFEKEIAKVPVTDNGDMITVGPKGYKNANYLTILSKKGIEKKDINAFVQKSFGDKNCKIVFEGEGALLRGATNAALVGEGSECSLMNMDAWYDVENKVFFMKNTGKVGDFFTVKGEDPVGALNDAVHESIRFAYLKDLSLKHYENKKYGFEVFIPSTWKGYSAKERILTGGDYEKTPSIDFSFGNEPVFSVSVHTKDAWKKIVAEEGPRPQYLGENDTHVFGFTMAQDGSAEVYKRWSEVALMLKSFNIK